jgi:hypothetical protein
VDDTHIDATEVHKEGTKGVTRRCVVPARSACLMRPVSEKQSEANQRADIVKIYIFMEISNNNEKL